jgi:hypothetical protein
MMLRALLTDGAPDFETRELEKGIYELEQLSLFYDGPTNITLGANSMRKTYGRGSLFPELGLMGLE